MISKATFDDVAEFILETMPLILFCENDEWKEYVPDCAVIDALHISASDLFGTDYRNHSYFTPDWLKDAARTNNLVITNLGKLPPTSDSIDIRCQGDFSHLIRTKDEPDAYRELNYGSGIFVPRELNIFIVIAHQNETLPFPFRDRCGILDLNGDQ